jgi:C4-dicarboxylate-specific signal transduction histidine kinase
MPADAEDGLRLDESDSPAALREANAALRARIADLEQRLRQRDDQRRAMIHIMGDLHHVNRRLADQRKAMLHILVDYEHDRRRLLSQAERLDNTRRALLHILQDSHESNFRLERSRKAMIHIMGDLHETTAQVRRREQDLRDKQEQLVQAAKLATLGELTTGVAHELNNPLNNIGLFIGNALDVIELGRNDGDAIRRELQSATRQVRKATEIISHLRTFGRAAPINREPVPVNQVIERALSLMSEQFRLREIGVELRLSAENPTVNGSPIQLEQAFINLLSNARDALMTSPRRQIVITSDAGTGAVSIAISDTGSGIPAGLEQRIFDPFFTTKEVGQGTGLGLSITYGIVQDHDGSITVFNNPDGGATFRIQLPRAAAEARVMVT